MGLINVTLYFSGSIHSTLRAGHRYTCTGEVFLLWLYNQTSLNNENYLMQNYSEVHLLFFTPFIFFANLFFLWRCEVIFYVEGLAYFIRSLPFNHVSHGFACDVQESLDIQVVGSQNKFKQSALVHLYQIDISKLRVITSLTTKWMI